MISSNPTKYEYGAQLYIVSSTLPNINNFETDIIGTITLRVDLKVMATNLHVYKQLKILYFRVYVFFSFNVEIFIP